jgi:hypothetical protein
LPGGLGKPMTQEDFVQILHAAGLTTADIRHCRWMADLHKAIGEDGWEEFMQEAHRLRHQSEHGQLRAAARAVLRRRTF